MKNQIHHISKEEAKEYLRQANQANSKVVIVDFKKITSWREYSVVMEKALEFPRPVQGSNNRFCDWMQDLMWFDNDRYDLFFHHFKNLSSKCFADAYEIYYDFKEIILPFWEYKAPHCIVGGKTKLFNVYIVE